MWTKKFYNNLPDMECLQGDTLDEFRIQIKDFDASNCSMQLIIEKEYYPEDAVKVKNCTFDGERFKVQLTSEDTKTMGGIYQQHFKLKDTEGKVHLDLYGKLIVRRTAQGE